MRTDPGVAGSTSATLHVMPAANGAPGGSSRPRTLVVIPAYNEEESLPKTLADLRSTTPELDVVVIDDGSRDRTADVARGAGAVCLQLPFNLGIGGALRTGFRYAVENHYERALQFDADGQHDATEIAGLLAELDAGADMVIGSRFAGEGDYQVGRSRGIAMRLLRWLIRRLAGKRFTDTSSGFRAFGPDVLGTFASDYPIEYMDSVEALVLACRAGFDVREVPTVMHEREAGQASNRRLRLAYHYIRVIVVLASSPRVKRPSTDEADGPR
jgi:glycosyltransferase involved in cell wall biosynthesis